MVEQQQEEVPQEVLDEFQRQQEDDSDNSFQNQTEDSEFLRQAIQDSPEKYNQHTFIHNSVFNSDSPIRTTYLSESEKGRALFNAIFIKDIINICDYQLKGIAEELGVENNIKIYFEQKLDSQLQLGMSHEGFLQNLNASKLIKTQRTRGNVENLNNQPKKRR